MATYIVDISRIGQPFFAACATFCAQLGQQKSTAAVYKECISQILSTFSSDPSVFSTDIYLLPQWVSITYVDAHPDHHFAQNRFRDIIRATAVELYGFIVLSGLTPVALPGSLYQVDSVNPITLQFSILTNSNML